MEAAPLIRAAGAVLFRRTRPGRIEVAVVHRPRYDDWTLPKGKLREGESVEDAAVREVEEETGIRGRLGPVAGEASYRDNHGRPKTVTYFFMTPKRGEFRPNEEVDELRWLGLEDAVERLSYERDREIVASLNDQPPPL